MPASIAAGRNMLLKKATVTIASVRVIGWSVDNTPIDITTADDAGFQKLMTLSAGRVLSINVSGVASDGVLAQVALGTGAGSQLLTDITLTDPSQTSTADVITCDFFVSNYKHDGDMKEAIAFSCTLTSSGTWTVG